MEFERHSTNNVLMKAPPNDPNCEDLPVTRVENTFVSFWRPSPEELALINSNGLIALWVFGDLHPPVAVTVEPTK